MGFLECSDKTYVLIISCGKLEMVELSSGKTIDQNIMPEDIVIDRLAVSADFKFVCVTLHDKKETDDWRWRVYRVDGLEWTQYGEDHVLDHQPWGLDWTSDDHLVIIDKV